MDIPRVLIVMGSESDLPAMEEAEKTLSEFRVPTRMAIASAHRTPEKAAALARAASAEGIRVIIAGAGGAAHLAGAMASGCLLPVIGVPLEASPLAGIDALLSTVQMPTGFPVATMAIGAAGARNAAILAVQILALSDGGLAKRLVKFRKKMAAKVEEADRKLQKR